MELLKSLETLNAPQAVRFNVLAFKAWRKETDANVKRAEWLEFFNECLRREAAMMKIESNKLRFTNAMAKSAVESLDRMNRLFPAFRGGRMKKETAMKAATLAYSAGFAQGLAKANEDTKETQHHREYSKAVKVLEKATNAMQRWFSENRLVICDQLVVDWGKPLIDARFCRVCGSELVHKACPNRQCKAYRRKVALRLEDKAVKVLQK